MAVPEEVEVKLRLQDAGAHAALARLLASGQRAKYEQENFFFDGPNRELNSQRVVLRLRFYNGDEKAVLTLKGKQLLVGGIGRASEQEAPVDPATARGWLLNPTAMLQQGPPLLQEVAAAYALPSLVSMGGFHNVRHVYDWQDQTLELDETQFEWGTVYELECETTEPEAVRDRLEALLTEHNVAHRHSTASKFKNFINRTLD